jgi:hypothetical protein
VKTGALTSVYLADGLRVSLEAASAGQWMLLFADGPDVGEIGDGDGLTLPTKVNECKAWETKFKNLRAGQVANLRVDYAFSPPGNPHILSCRGAVSGKVRPGYEPIE